MTANFKRVFGGVKPVIGMVHIGALPGSPMFDPNLDLPRGAQPLAQKLRPDIATLVDLMLATDP